MRDIANDCDTAAKLVWSVLQNESVKIAPLPLWLLIRYSEG